MITITSAEVKEVKSMLDNYWADQEVKWLNATLKRRCIVQALQREEQAFEALKLARKLYQYEMEM